MPRIRQQLDDPIPKQCNGLQCSHVHVLHRLHRRHVKQCHHWGLTSEVSPASSQNKTNQICWQSREESSQRLTVRKTKKPLYVVCALHVARQRALEDWDVVFTGALLELKGMTEARGKGQALWRTMDWTVFELALDDNLSLSPSLWRLKGCDSRVYILEIRSKSL